MKFNEMFGKWRIEQRLTQKEAAELIGISQGTYSRFEKHGVAGMKTEQLIQNYYDKNKSEFGGEDYV